MEVINIKDFDSKFTTAEIQLLIKHLINKDCKAKFEGIEINTIHKLFCIADIIKHISNKNVLESYIKLFVETKLLSVQNNEIETINFQINQIYYSDVEKIIIESHYLSNLIEFQLLQKNFK